MSSYVWISCGLWPWLTVSLQPNVNTNLATHAFHLYPLRVKMVNRGQSDSNALNNGLGRDTLTHDIWAKYPNLISDIILFGLGKQASSVPVH